MKAVAHPQILAWNTAKPQKWLEDSLKIHYIYHWNFKYSQNHYFYPIFILYSS